MEQTMETLELIEAREQLRELAEEVNSYDQYMEVVFRTHEAFKEGLIGSAMRNRLQEIACNQLSHTLQEFYSNDD